MALDEWPPRRSSARSGSSRFTRAPGATSASDERAQRLVHHVGAEAVAVGADRGQADAVDGDRVTVGRSPASAVATRRRTPSSVASTAATVPRSATSPVNSAHHSLRRAVIEDVAGERLAVEREGAQRVGDAVDALALERIARRRGRRARAAR